VRFVKEPRSHQDNRAQGGIVAAVGASMTCEASSHDILGVRLQFVGDNSRGRHADVGTGQVNEGNTHSAFIEPRRETLQIVGSDVACDVDIRHASGMQEFAI